MSNKKSATQGETFKVNEHIVYPAHGVGQITEIEEHPRSLGYLGN